MEVVAHRAGNLAQLLAEVGDRADTIELDVHLFRSRLEVRHEKVFWPFAARWEKWEITPGDTPRPSLDEILAVTPDSVPLWFDLKGFTPRLTRRVLTASAPRSGDTMSSRAWWILGPARRRDVRVLRSVGNRMQLWLVSRRRRRHGDGVVMHSRFATPDVVRRLHERWSTVFVWAVDDAGRARELAEMGIDGLIVDDLSIISDR